MAEQNLQEAMKEWRDKNVFQDYCEFFELINEQVVGKKVFLLRMKDGIFEMSINPNAIDEEIFANSFEIQDLEIMPKMFDWVKNNVEDYKAKIDKMVESNKYNPKMPIFGWYYEDFLESERS